MYRFNKLTDFLCTDNWKVWLTRITEEMSVLSGLVMLAFSWYSGPRVTWWRLITTFLQSMSSRISINCLDKIAYQVGSWPGKVPSGCREVLSGCSYFLSCSQIDDPIRNQLGTLTRDPSHQSLLWNSYIELVKILPRQVALSLQEMLLALRVAVWSSFSQERRFGRKGLFDMQGRISM